MSLLAMAAIGSTLYIIDGRPEIYNGIWIILGILWYLGIAFALYFMRYGARLGALTAGILGWLSLAFYLINSFQFLWGSTMMVSSTDPTISILNSIGAGIAAVVVVTSHNLFHKFQ